MADSSDLKRSTTGPKTRLKNQFDHLTREELLEILRELSGPLREMELSGESGDVAASDVCGEVMLALVCNPRLEALFTTKAERELWESFKKTRGDGPTEIGEFVYGPDENPWREANSSPSKTARPGRIGTPRD